MVSTDTRNIAKGSLFFALKGDRFDANTFAAKALEAGAAYAVVDDPHMAGSDERFVVVDNSLRTLQQLAAHHRRKLSIPILAITGTNGKTTTKELIGRVLAQKFRISITQGNLNNHIGVPLTLLGMNGDTQFGIVEMGAGAQGEIALLSSITQPNYGIITNIGRAHLEGFGSVEGIIKGKGELFDYLDSNCGTAFYSECDETVNLMARSRKNLHKVGYPCLESETVDGKLAVTYHCKRIVSHLVGDYNRMNISAAVAIGGFFGIADPDITAAIESYEPDNKRSQKIAGARNTLIADCYNANPSSMAATIDNFVKEVAAEPKAIILGDMLELGDYAAEEHRLVVERVAASPIDKILLVGENFQLAAAASTDSRIRRFETFDDLAAFLRATPLAGHLILLKGSRGIGLERAIELL